MNRLFVAALLVAALINGAPATVTAQERPLLALTHANVIDGVTDQPIRDATVIVRDGKIEVVRTGEVSIPPGATVLDLKGKWLLPGLIDGHVHFDDLTAAKIALASGITTVRTGSSLRFMDVGIRDLNHAGMATFPDVVAVGYQIIRQPGEVLLLDFPVLVDLMKGIRGPDALRRMVRALVSRRVDAIKILVTERGGIADMDPRRRMFTDEEIAAVVDEARRAGREVMAHAHGDEGAAAAVRAGARTIEHGTFLTDETLKLMKERGTYLVPTITTAARGAEAAGPIIAARARVLTAGIREMLRRAMSLGVRIVAGSDVKYDDGSRLQDEIIHLAQYGLTPMAAIKAGTSMGAAALKIDTRTGAIKPGLEADLIVVGRDPLVDLEMLRDVLLVVNNGRIAVNRLAP